MAKKKTGHRVKLSYRTLNDNKAENLSFFSPNTVDLNAISNLCQTCMDVELTEIWEGKEGYVYPATSGNYKFININCSGSFQVNGLWYPTEKMYIKHVKKEYTKKEALLPFFQAIYGTSFKFRAFDIVYK